MATPRINRRGLKDLRAICEYRHPRPRKRQISIAVRRESAAGAIGAIYPGMEKFIFTKGQFPLVDVITHLLGEIADGQEDVHLDVSTFTACPQTSARFQMKDWLRYWPTPSLTSQHGVVRARFVTDYTMPTRHPEHFVTLVNSLPADSVRLSVIHAKFITIRKGEWAIAIRTSMNLNNSPRFESIEISDDPKLASMMTGIMDEIWETQQSGDERLAEMKSSGEYDQAFFDTDATPQKIVTRGPSEVAFESWDWEGKDGKERIIQNQT